MKVKQDSTVVRRTQATGSRLAVSDASADWTNVETVLDVVSRLPNSQSRFVARAPITLDVLGGLADYSGALTLRFPLGEYVCAAVQLRDDSQLVIERCHHAGANGRPSMALPIAEIIAAHASENVTPLTSKLGASGGVVERCVLGVVSEVIRAELVDGAKLGLTVAVGSSHELGQESAGTIAAAVLTAISGALDLELEPTAAALRCQAVENSWLDVPAGVGDGAGALMSEAGCINEHRCDTNTLGGRMPMPAGLTMIGLASCAMRQDFVDKYRRVRTATFMGRFLIDRIIQHDGVGNLQWDGNLSRISVTDYVERFRDRIPTRLKGREFLEHFGETGDPLTRIEPAFTYKIRSRTEHHVYEHGRARQFVEGLSRFSRNQDLSILGEVGELMFASHWSYGQRCGLGSIETDLLVNLVRRYGARSGVHGARISGRGCGGMVAVLMDDTDAALQAVQQACEAYHEKTGRAAVVVRNSLPGAMVAGARAV